MRKEVGRVCVCVCTCTCIVTLNDCTCRMMIVIQSQGTNINIGGTKTIIIVTRQPPVSPSSCPQMTWASISSQLSSHTVPNCPLRHTSTRPLYAFGPSASRTSPLVQLPPVIIKEQQNVERCRDKPEQAESMQQAVIVKAQCTQQCCYMCSRKQKI